MKEVTTGIYKITNPKGKVYIGQSVDINRRWRAYQSPDLRKMGKKLYNSLCYYGPQNHTYEILEVCSVSELLSREVYYKQVYSSVQIGLNAKLGDDRAGTHTQETKKLISEKCTQAAKKRDYSQEWKASMRAKKLNHPCYADPVRNKKIGDAHRGKIVPETVKQKIYTEQWLHNVRIQNKKNNKKVVQLSKELIEIRTWDSISEAREQTGIKGISNNLTGRAAEAGGFIWKYLEV